MNNSSIKQFEHILELSDGIDSIMIADKTGRVEYWKCAFKPYLVVNQIVGMRILDVYPELTEETSTLMRVIRTGKAVLNERQDIVNYKKEHISLICNTFPIFENGEVIGAVETNAILETDHLHLSESVEYSGIDSIITQNKEMQRLKERILAVAHSNSSVLIQGETGTGKELVAQALHVNGKRRGFPLISQNCAAIPDNLMESMFFGTEKGSYTGAENKKGLFELAHMGTLFLDEINSMTLPMQSKLLRVLEEKKVRRVGGSKDIPIDVRIVCATNEPLEKLLQSGRLREDLYYRISVVKLQIPPLRQRKDDILLLTDHFIRYYNREMCKNVCGLSKIVENIFLEYQWPGNVRQLKNSIESAFNTVCSEEILLQDVHEFMAAGNSQEFIRQGKPAEEGMAVDFESEDISLQKAVESYEKKLLMEAVGKYRGLSEAARKLKLSPQSLRYKLEKYNLHF